ncbi:hypothetical protein OG455_17025 [Kitasatospora sp. NBC_01287]|uniref:hypothetical protein n=1 Tax=Kitasatospora sp. NBC_01287 TaxID=2903573 RepID=UPI002250DA0D|nr:hypothetical protein [Kitasatospora sp. NBC_01287]MCX4747201.1 hypothetical protein [Kitasatospora sp. NBC_01287]
MNWAEATFFQLLGSYPLTHTFAGLSAGTVHPALITSPLAGNEDPAPGVAGPAPPVAGGGTCAAWLPAGPGTPPEPPHPAASGSTSPTVTATAFGRNLIRTPV